MMSTLSYSSNSSHTPYPSHDYQIDIYRALMMIYVPCIIHVMYWLGKGDAFIKPLLLFEMPVIFYISGATMYVTGKKRKFMDFIKNRANRLLLPYLFFIIGCFIFIILRSTVYSENINFKEFHILKVLLAQDSSLPIRYMFHLWFIVPYLIVSCSFSIQQKWADKINRWIYILILLITCLIGYGATAIHPYLKPLREALFYNCFFMSGYLFYKRISFRTLLTITILSLVITLLLIGYDAKTTGAFSMQSHKFPPDFLFISFGFSAIGILSLLFGSFSIPSNRLLRHWNKYGYTIYLWQNFSFLAYEFIYRYCNIEIIKENKTLDLITASVVIFLISTITSLIIVPLEKKFINLCKKKCSQLNQY